MMSSSDNKDEDDAEARSSSSTMKMKPIDCSNLQPVAAEVATINPNTTAITGISGTGATTNTNDDGSPNVECFQNFTAPEVFIQGLAGMVNQQDVETIIKSQKYMMQRFEKTNEMLVNCNELAAVRFQNAVQDFKKHVQLLKEFNKDMDSIFKRIRVIKAKLAAQYPQQFEVAASIQRKEKNLNRGEDDDDDD